MYTKTQAPMKNNPPSRPLLVRARCRVVAERRVFVWDVVPFFLIGVVAVFVDNRLNFNVDLFEVLFSGIAMVEEGPMVGDFVLFDISVVEAVS